MASQPERSDVAGDWLLPLSALNDLLYCDRRCWLHRVAGLDADNAHTLLGQHEHERVDEASVENRPGVRVERGLPLVSHELGLIGRADVVEFHRQGSGFPPRRIFDGVQGSDQSEIGNLKSEIPYPVDYKHGRRRRWDNDDVQLCAQAMCLEEMLGVPVRAGAVFHVTTKRRREVMFTEQLRQQVQAAAAELHRLVKLDQPPLAVLKPQCDGCAMRTHCLPEAGAAEGRIRVHLRVLFVPDS